MDGRPLVFSDDEEEEKTTDELGNFIDNGLQPEEDVSFYRQLDPENIDDYSRFNGQTRNPVGAIYEDDTPFYGREDQQPGRYTPEDKESVSFDKSEGCEKFIYLYLNISIEKFKKSLKIFEDRENQVFDAVIYDIMYYRCDGEPIVREKMIEILGGNFFNNLKEIEEEIKLERHFLDILIGVLNRTRSQQNIIIFLSFSRDEIRTGFL